MCSVGFFVRKLAGCGNRPFCAVLFVLLGNSFTQMVLNPVGKTKQNVLMYYREGVCLEITL